MTTGYQYQPGDQRFTLDLFLSVMGHQTTVEVQLYGTAGGAICAAVSALEHNAIHATVTDAKTGEEIFDREGGAWMN